MGDPGCSVAQPRSGTEVRPRQSGEVRRPRDPKPREAGRLQGGTRTGLVSEIRATRSGSWPLTWGCGTAAGGAAAALGPGLCLPGSSLVLLRLSPRVPALAAPPPGTQLGLRAWLIVGPTAGPRGGASSHDGHVALGMPAASVLVQPPRPGLESRRGAQVWGPALGVSLWIPRRGAAVHGPIALYILGVAALGQCTGGGQVTLHAGRLPRLLTAANSGSATLRPQHRCW